MCVEVDMWSLDDELGNLLDGELLKHGALEERLLKGTVVSGLELSKEHSGHNLRSDGCDMEGNDAEEKRRG